MYAKLHAGFVSLNPGEERKSVRTVRTHDSRVTNPKKPHPLCSYWKRDCFGVD